MFDDLPVEQQSLDFLVGRRAFGNDAQSVNGFLFTVGKFGRFNFWFFV